MYTFFQYLFLPFDMPTPCFLALMWKKWTYSLSVGMGFLLSIAISYLFIYLFIYLQIYLPGYIKNGRPYQNFPKNLKDSAISPDTIRGGKW